MTDPLFKVNETEHDQKQYLKDYIIELNKKIKLYNECNILIKKYKNTRSFLKRDNDKFKIFFDYYMNLESNKDIRNMIEKSFNTSITMIYSEILDIENNIKNNNDITLISYIHEKYDELETMYSIGYANNIIIAINRYLDSFLANKFNGKKIKACIERELESLVTKLENLMNSIEMPY